ncbi:hypothetical protein Tfer_1427 [Thermincola ferriacetica]|uniref:CBS domain containing membrane protein n=2 Tax=Thermincola TaxID=278993 RepID=D5XBX8_THEPJ|nr:MULTISPECIES: CBS domain-containing protein [Thermincola]ADG81526.1 CBS domain containing membrane protein [Thermincola potens JR]KNZ69817.1 hypothetical protein Tfer_1427 [Thermincola ferriacetica]
MQAKDIMTKEVITARPEQTVREVAKILADKKISGVPVVDEAGKIVGIVTEADLLVQTQKLKVPSYVQLLGGIIYLDSVKEFEEDLRKAVAVQVKDIMTTDVVTVEEDAEIEDIATTMADEGINRLPVVRDGALVGIVSRADIVKALAKRD